MASSQALDTARREKDNAGRWLAQPWLPVLSRQGARDGIPSQVHG